MRLVAAVAALAMAQSAAINPPSAVPTPRSIDVRIDLVASDARGRIIDNLKPSDFQLRDDGTALAAETIRVVRHAADAGRAIALFLDEYHVDRENTVRVREALARWVERDVTDRDRIVVLKPLDSLLAIGPAHDRDAARAIIETFDGRRGDYEPRNAYERNFLAGAPARIDAARTQVALSAINALAVHFASYPDQRKTLIVVSEGMGRGERRRGMEYLPTPETIVRSAQKANVSIYALNPATPSEDGDAVRALVLETAGGVIASDLDEGLRRAMDDASGYYLLSYSASKPDDGRFHAVQVQVKRPGAQLRVRSGYYAPSPDDTLRETLLARLNEPKPVAPPEPAPHTSTLIRPWFGMSRGADGRTRVTIVWEAIPRPIFERIRRTPSRVVLTALAADNSVLFEGPLNPSGPALVEDPAGVPSRAVFEALPGRVRLRMAIQDSAQQVLDTDVRSMTVRDMRKGVVIGTPEVLRARNAREFRTLESALAVPVAAREFSRTERLLVRFQAYGIDDSPVSVSARLLSRMGPMRDLPITERENGPDLIDVSLAGLAVGEYVIEVSATSGGGEAKDVIDFRVTN